MATFCANCTTERGPFVVDSEGFTVCVRCETEPPTVDDGPDRGYEPTGGLPTIAESSRACRNDEAYHRLAKLDEEHARTPTRARDRSEVEWREYINDSFQRERSGAARFNRTSAEKARGSRR